MTAGLGVRGDRLVNSDGSVFHWLADTWWWGASGRISTADFEKLAVQRAQQGFTVVQLVVGLASDADAQDPRQGNAGGPVFDGRGRPNVGYLDVAAERVWLLLEAGLTPCVVGAWGYQLERIGLEAMLEWWHALIERFAALPVVWCAAGEALMPHYSELGGPGQAAGVERLREGWTQVLAEIRRADPHRRPLTVHPSAGVGHFSSADMLDVGLTDFIMLQAGHEGVVAAERGVELLERMRVEHPGAPVVQAEVCYEGIMGANWQDVQRFAYWAHLLGGAAGYSYGAQGLWAFDSGPDDAIGQHWGAGDWRTATAYPGAGQLGLGRRLAEQWGRLEPAAGLVTPTASPGLRVLPCAARAETGEVVVYLPSPGTAVPSRYLRELAVAAVGEATWIDPRTGARQPCSAESEGGVTRLAAAGMTVAPTLEDWLLVIQPTGAEG